MKKEYIAEIVDVSSAGDNVRVSIRTIDRWGSNIRETYPLRRDADIRPGTLPRLMTECGLIRDWDRPAIEDARRLVGRRLVTLEDEEGRWTDFRAAPEIREPELIGLEA